MACELVMSAHGVVSALCIDKINGCIVAGVQDTIRYLVSALLPSLRPKTPPPLYCLFTFSS